MDNQYIKTYSRLLKYICCLITASLLTISSQATVKLPRLISDGMILQRETSLKIWGWADPGEVITLRFKGKSHETKADNKGEWLISLPAQKAGGPYEMSINNIIIKDILLGDVWLCSGQSNMDLPIKRTLDLYKKEVENVNNPNIRLFQVPTKYNFVHAESDLSGGSWKQVTPTNVLDFSAVAYFFGKNLYEKYLIPIGLLNPSEGGTNAESWVSAETLKKYPEPYEEYQLIAQPNYVDSVISVQKAAGKKWEDDIKEKDQGSKHWFKEELNISEWQTMKMPGYWENKGLGKIHGVVWFRKEINVPASMTGKEGELRLGCIVDSDQAYINGTFVGSTSYQYPPRIYKIPAGLLKEGKNTITVRVVNNSGKGGFVEGKAYKVIIDNENIDLVGDWKYKVGVEMPQRPSETRFVSKPVGLYNAMIAPLQNYPIKGFVWYQGENNANRAGEYKRLLPDLINNWRTLWNSPKAPFLIVQLPNYMQPKSKPSDSGWAQLRNAQREAAMTIPNTGLAVTIDLGEHNDIHPLKKKEVGERLALLAGKLAYADKNTVASGPIYEKMEINGNKIILTFSSIGSGLSCDGKELKEFAIAGTNKNFVWAKAKIVGKNKIVVWSDEVTNPRIVRYAWANNPNKANLKNKEGLLASPFTTETK